VTAGDLELTEIQGNIVPGFNKHHQAFVLVHFGAAAAVRSWLRSFHHDGVWDVTTAHEAQSFKHLHALAARRRQGEASSLLAATWLNLAFSHRGLDRLRGPEQATTFNTGCAEEQFHQNAYPEGGEAVHAVVILAADRAGDLEAELRRQQSKIHEHSLRVIDVLRGDRLEGSREHFGFKDGLAQPNIKGAPGSSRTYGPVIEPGEFIVGYRDQQHKTIGDDFGRNGSYLVLLKLRQDVAAFRDSVKGAEGLGAAIVGRWPDGEKIGGPLQQLSHIGRALPEKGEVEPDSPDRHRLIRRGIPYGPPLGAGEADDGRDRGLLFVAYQADIARQFEHVWARWLQNPEFPAPGAGRDPLVGSANGGSGQRDVRVPRVEAKGGTAHLKLPQFVTVNYGGYFFSPSISSLACLAGMAGTRQPASAASIQERATTNVPHPMIYVPKNGGKFDYLQLVLEENPYGIDPNGITLPGTAEVAGPFAANRGSNGYPNGRSLQAFLAAATASPRTPNYAPADSDVLAMFPHWQFGEDSVRISKAIRITYSYSGPHSDTESPRTFIGHILIGYGGPAWP
jgi:Dyp-type peroxidase family